jgi:hypothetical protein
MFGIGYRILYNVHTLSHEQKHTVFKCSGSVTFLTVVNFTSVFKDKKVIKKSHNSLNQDF